MRGQAQRQWKGRPPGTVTRSWLKIESRIDILAKAEAKPERPSESPVLFGKCWNSMLAAALCLLGGMATGTPAGAAGLGPPHRGGDAPGSAQLSGGKEQHSAPLDVPFTVKSVAGIQVSGFPVSVAIPLPRGAFREVDGFRVTDAGGKAVPAQISVLNRWWAGDQSIRHVLIHFQPSVPALAGGITPYRLVNSHSPVPSVAPVMLSETPERITVNTGPLLFTVRKKSGFTLIDELWLDRNADRKFTDDEKAIAPNRTNGGVLIPAGNLTTGVQQDSSRGDVEVTIEERGPLRVVIRAEARTLFKSLANITHGWAVRIYAYAGKPYIKLDYQVQNSANHVATAGPLYFKALALRFKLGFHGEPSVTLGRGDGTAYSRVRGKGLLLAQTSHDSYEARDLASPAPLFTGKAADGYLDARDSRQGITAVLRHFWETWPNGLALGADNTLSLQLMPEWGHQMYWKPTDIYWLQDMQHVYKEVLLYFHDGRRSPAELSALARIFQTPPVAIVSKSWYQATRATLDLGGVIPPRLPAPRPDPLIPPYAPQNFQRKSGAYVFNWRLFRIIDPDRVEAPAAGGGWPYSIAAYIANESAAARILGEQYALGELNCRPQWLAGYRYRTDFSATQLGVRLPWNSPSYRVDGKPGPYPVPNTGPISVPRDAAHGWQYHVAEAYFLTGNPWILDWYRFMGEFRKAWLASNQWGASREIGHVIGLAMDAYKITGDPELLDLVHRYINEFLRKDQNPQYGYRNSLCCGKYGEAAFQAGFLARAMINFREEVREADPQGYADAFQFLSGVMAWNLNYSHFSYYIDARKETGTSNGTALTFVDPQAWYYRHTGKQEYWNQAVDYIDGGIAGGQGAYGDFGAWHGQYEDRYFEYVKQVPKTDTTPPARIGDLAAAVKGGSVALSWTAPGEVARYHLVFGDKPLSERQNPDPSQLNWWAASVKAVRPAGSPGKRQFAEIEIPAGNSGKTLYFAAFGFDGEENMSAMSNVAKIVIP
jgi:hypothetical protein